MKTASLLRNGLEGRSFKASVLFYLFGLAAMAPPAALIALAFGAETTFRLTPLLAAIVIAGEHVALYSRGKPHRQPTGVATNPQGTSLPRGKRPCPACGGTGRISFEGSDQPCHDQEEAPPWESSAKSCPQCGGEGHVDDRP